MKAMALTGVGRMGMIDRPDPRIEKDNDVLITHDFSFSRTLDAFDLVLS